MGDHRAGGGPTEKRLSDGRCVLVSERRMPDGGIAGIRVNITTLKAVEELLREKQRMLNRAQRISGTGSAVRKLTTDIADWSDEMYRIFGVGPDFVPTTKAFVGLMHSEDRDRVATAIAASDRGLDQAPIQFRIVRPDGAIRWVYRDAELWNGDDGKPAMLLTTYKDVTEQRAAEARQRELEILLRDAIDSISEGFVLWDGDDRLVLCNEAYRQLYPANLNLVPGKLFVDILQDAAWSGRHADAAGREAEWIEERIQRRRVPIRSKSKTNSPTAVDPDLGAPHEQRRHRRVARRHHRAEKGAGGAPREGSAPRTGAAYLPHRQRLPRHRDRQRRRMVRRDVPDLRPPAGRSTAEPRHVPLAGHSEDDKKVVNLSLDNVTAVARPAEFRIVRPDGEIRWLHREGELRHDAAGAPIGWLSTYQDITDLKLTQDIAARKPGDAGARAARRQDRQRHARFPYRPARDFGRDLSPVRHRERGRSLRCAEFPRRCPSRGSCRGARGARDGRARRGDPAASIPHSMAGRDRASLYRGAEIWRDADGTPIGITSIYKDITEQYLAEQRQRELEIMLRDAIESLSEGFVIFDAEDRLVICNEAYRQLYPDVAPLIVPGTSYEDILRAGAKAGATANFEGQAEEWIQRMLQTHRDPTAPFISRLKDGRWMLVSKRRMSNGGIAGVRVDITELKRAQQALRDSEARLDRTQRIAHIGSIERDLRTNELVWSDETYRSPRRQSHDPPAQQ